MVSKSLNYQIMVKRFITIPFLLVIAICFIAYLAINLVNTIQHEVQATKNINNLLVRSAANGNSTLIADQVQTTLAQSPYIESINFFPFSSQQAVENDKLNLKNIFFDQYFGISQPVKLDLLRKDVTHNTAVNQLIGYMNITLDLGKIREQWFYQNLPMFVFIIVIASINLFIVLRMINRLTYRLPKLETLSKHILHDDFVEAEYIDLSKDNEPVWVFEKALAHLLNKQKTQTFQIDQLVHDKNAIKEAELKQIQQHSSFQNTLTHEFKISLNRIEAGLQLLQNQYISSEQKDAIEIINLGKDDLNAKLNQIIQMNRIEKGQTGIESYQFSPSKLITQITDQYQNLAKEKNIFLISKIYHADYILEGDVQKITLIISSLVENAIKFTEKGGVTVISQLQHLEKDIRWSIQVQDTGLGIAEQYQQLIFEPFFQINPEVKHTNKSNTVGLFLTKKLVELLHGEITVSSDNNQGTTFNLSLVLKDWKNSFERTLLQDKKIALWYRNDESLPKSQRLMNAGALVKEFKDDDLLLDYLCKNETELLIISKWIPATEAITFIKELRDKEQNHRVLTIYYYTPPAINSRDKESLRAAGIDYIENDSKMNETKDEYIKQVVKYLN